MKAVLRIGAALAAGLTFGLGLSLSGMPDPTRVRGFLDVTGAWDSTLTFVLVGAALVATIGYRVPRLLAHPAFDDRFHFPAKRTIDIRLVLGAVLFGVGWGLSGFCPGPAVAALSVGAFPAVPFVAAMSAGMIIFGILPKQRN